MSSSGSIFAIRAVSATSEMLMIENLRENLNKTPLLPWILDYSSMGTKTRGPILSKQQFKSPSSASLVKRDKSTAFRDVLESVLVEYRLNEDQRQ